MKRIIAIGAALIVALTGCSKAPDAPVVTQTVTVTESKTLPLPTTVPPTNSQYLDVMREVDPNIDSDLAMQLGVATCDALDRGVTVREMFEMGLAKGLDLEVLGQQIAASAMFLCPKHVDNIDKQFAELM